MPCCRAQRLAQVIVRLACRLLRDERCEWAAAMRSELAFIDGGRAALAWACGCLVAAAKERIAMMRAGNLRISPPVAALEMLFCFAPLTLGWWDALAGVSGLVRLLPIIEHGQLARVPGAESYAALMVFMTIISSAGPLGLVLAFRSIVLGRGLRNRWLRGALIAGPLLWGASSLLGHGVQAPGADNAFDFWSGMLMLCALPVSGALHLAHLRPVTPEGGSGLLAAG